MPWLRHSLAPIATFIVGLALLIWLAVEIAIVGYTNDPPLQPFYLIVGAVISLVGLGWMVETAPADLRHGAVPR
jgi:hypothetical protein